jgi:hypothetical protein
LPTTLAKDIYPLKDYFNLSHAYFHQKAGFPGLFCLHVGQIIIFSGIHNHLDERGRITRGRIDCICEHVQTIRKNFNALAKGVVHQKMDMKRLVKEIINESK